MKRLFLILLVVITFCSVSGVHAFDLTVQTGLSTNWWDSDTDDRGSQTYVPVTIDGVQGDFSLRLLTAFVHTRVDPSDASKESLSTVVDTKLNFSYAIVEKLPVDILLGLDFNLPTGKTDLDDEDRRTLLDPDLVAISRYGEGFNINPTITLAKQEELWGVGVGFGYLLRGEYDFSDTAQNYDPGEIFNISAEGFYVPFTQPMNWTGRTTTGKVILSWPAWASIISSKNGKPRFPFKGFSGVRASFRPATCSLPPRIGPGTETSTWPT